MHAEKRRLDVYHGTGFRGERDSVPAPASGGASRCARRQLRRDVLARIGSRQQLVVLDGRRRGSREDGLVGPVVARRPPGELGQVSLLRARRDPSAEQRVSVHGFHVFRRPVRVEYVLGARQRQSAGHGRVLAVRRVRFGIPPSSIRQAPRSGIPGTDGHQPDQRVRSAVVRPHALRVGHAAGHAGLLARPI